VAGEPAVIADSVASRRAARSGAAPWVLAIVAGMALWLVATLVSGRREPWDAASYWWGAYPAAIAVSAGLGYRWPVKPWRWPLALFEAQLVAMWLRAGEPGNLWPLAMVLFAVIALPGVAVAALASRCATRSPT
jgi:hypothetical protein